MTKFEFTVDGKLVSLDTATGSLTCEDSVVLGEIESEVKAGVSYGGCFGGWEPLEWVEVSDPYHDIRQFTACIFHLLPFETFPEVLKPYAPRYAALYEGMKPGDMFDPEDMRRYRQEAADLEKERKELGLEILY